MCIRDRSNVLIYLLYFGIVGFSILAAIFNKSKDKTFNEKLDFVMKDMFSTSEVKQTPSAKLYELGARAVGIFLLVMFILASCEYIAKHLDVWVLSNDKSIIAIKRNNDVYILKSFDQKTMVLGQGFEIIKRCV